MEKTEEIVVARLRAHCIVRPRTTAFTAEHTPSLLLSQRPAKSLLRLNYQQRSDYADILHKDRCGEADLYDQNMAARPRPIQTILGGDKQLFPHKIRLGSVCWCHYTLDSVGDRLWRYTYCLGRAEL